MCAMNACTSLKVQMRKGGPVARALSAKEPERHIDQATDSDSEDFEVTPDTVPVPPPARGAFLVLASPGSLPCKCPSCSGADCTDLRGIHTTAIPEREPVAIAGIRESLGGHICTPRGHKVVECQATLQEAFELYLRLGPLHEAPLRPKLHFW